MKSLFQLRKAIRPSSFLASTFLFTLIATSLGAPLVASADTIPVTLENGNNRPLGTGYDSRSALLRNVCVDNLLDGETEPPVFKPELPRGSFDLKLESSQESLSDKLGISIGGRYRTGVTTVSASADFLNQSQSNSFSIAYNYVSEHLFQETMNPTRARPIRPLPGFAETVKDSSLFFDTCGDEYVRARDMAARLFVNVNVSFVSKSERTRFAAKFGLESPVTSFSADFENDRSSFSANNRMTVRVIQVGGDPAKVGRVLCPKNTDGTPDAECERGAKAVVDCSFGEIKRCTNLIANAIAYANAQDGDNFPTQIRNGQNYSVAKLHTAPFISLGQPFVSPPRRERQLEFEAAVKQLSDIFESQYSLWSYSNKLYTGRAPRLSDRQKNEMEKIQNTHFKNVRRAAKAVESCFNLGYDVCSTQVDEVRQFVGLTERGDIDAIQYDAIERLTAAETFVQYCDIASDDNPEIKTTVDSLRTYALSILGEEGAHLNKGDRCRNLEEWLTSQTELDLSKYPSLRVGALEPIATLKNIEKLNLKGKAIRSIAALAWMTNLKELALDDNLVGDLSPLKTLTRLERLSIQNNNVNRAQLSQLSDLDRPNGSLGMIDARGNQDGLVCPLKEANRCKLLNFTDAVNTASMSEQCTLKIGHQAIAISQDQVLVTGGYSLDRASYYRSDMQIVGRDGCKPLSQIMTWGRAGHTMTTLHDGSIFVAGGHTEKLEIIDPVSFKATALSATMKDLRSQHTATLLSDGRVLIVGGYMDPIDYRTRSNNISASVEVFDPNTQRVDVLGKLALPRAEHTATLLNDGRVLITGGYTTTRMLNSAEVIDPKAGTIETLDESFHIGRMGHSSIKLADGRVLIAGGYRWDSKVQSGVATKTLVAVPEMEIFDPSNVSFKLVEERLSPARGSIQSWALPDGRVMLVGGESEGRFFDGTSLAMPSAQKTIQIFDPLTEGLYFVGELKYGRHLFTVTPIGKRSALVVGGVGDTGASSSVELIVYRPH